ncbi:cytochrome P450 [Amycolatopsis regifaucium]|uniref:cytochrome P450 n=1 Tax=Amycolatopsis regifaucium TaxID=546365 RepID=UPI0008F67C08|nr:cytochrome P450 [Amycolatopsis regifaucium]SFH41712.1 Cytochrome P450 [Amycolatopsis regifaucium]
MHEKNAQFAVGARLTRERCQVSGSCPVSYPFPWTPPLEIPEKWRDLRERPIVEITLPSGDPALLVTRYRDVKALFADVRLSRNTAWYPTSRISLNNNLFSDPEIDSDPPRYSAERGLVTRAFSARHIEALRPLAVSITGELLDRMAEGASSAELNETIAFPLPIRVICHLLGIPEEDMEVFRGLVDGFLSISKLPDAEVARCREDLWSYIDKFIRLRRETPGEDLTSALIQISDGDQDRLSDYQLHHWIRTLLIAGYITTASQIGSSMAVLLHRPEVVADLRADYSLIPSAVEELLRYELMGSSLGSLRYALEDIELADGSVVPKGSTVLLSTEANVDETAFPDPLKLDIRRTNNHHLTFGSGIHYCVGAALARMELQVATEGLLRRFPGLRLAVPAADLPRKFGGFLEAFAEIPVEW